MDWECVIGLEVHVQLRTQSKIFSGASTAYGAAPNTQACAVDIGLPGVLPVMNREAALMAARFGIAVDATIHPVSVFARKNYFYPDLPKGYQISQFEIPIVEGGHLDIETPEGSKTIRITRAHLEEDAGKSLHEDFHGFTGIDLNRAGTPLLEIVSEPDLSSPEEAVAYLKKLHGLVKALKICDGNMQEGSFRCDANVSVRPKGESKLGTRTELKNINSFRFVEQAINFEIDRQTTLLEEGGRVIQETRLYDPDKNTTRPMRSKEEAHDYRYFPDPDLPPLTISEEEIRSLRESMPELPDARYQRLVRDYGLTEDEASQLTQDLEWADFFESLVTAADGESRLSVNWLLGDLASALNREGLAISECPVSTQQLGALLKRIKDGTISGKIAKKIFATVWENGSDIDTIIEREGLTQITDHNAIEAAVDTVIASFPAQADQVRSGEEKVIGFLVGQVMKATAGKANPKGVNDIVRKKLLG
ncbi:MAG: Asp-tRNA(Asn)/Glu-tRNA(Gln) amidotransferase subunit GatB [Gammaproteobacteria bacterium]|nr:Asp-tRNA(Asn)/Glu-tRNA(Gln) amidotransferase subunit GatB [Gammaproteobacteria bacterium]